MEKTTMPRKKLMDRVEFDFKHTDDFLEVESVFDRKKSFFKDLVNAVGDYSASLLSKHKLQINYELVVPESVSSVTVDNRFGDVHLGDIKGRAKLTIAHGDLKVDRLADYSRINLNYGKIRAKEVGEANFTLKGAELEVDFAGKLNIVSSSSTLMIENALVLDLESTNDKIFFEHVRDLSGAANFTEMTVSNLSEVVRLNQSYGEMTIKSIPESFRSVRLQGKSTDYVLNFSNRSSFDSRIYARSDKLKIADFPGEREKRYMDDKSKFVQITGSFGYKNTEQRLNLDAQNGDVTIDFIEMSQETKRK